METAAQTLEQALAELDRIAPDAPLLALGQTVFWDEPMKAGVALAARRPFIGGVHDTDYFAKLPSGAGGRPGIGRPFVTVPHNDTRTKGLWSAAAEFSSLFGSETVITRESLLAHGLRIEKVLPGRPNLLDEATEAWGWRGVVATSEDAPVTAEVPIDSVYPALRSTLKWAVDETLSCISEPDRLLAQERADRLLKLLDDTHASATSLADFYKRLLPAIYAFTAGEPLQVESTRTTKILQFNTATCEFPRFGIVDAFLRTETSAQAHEAYNEAIQGSEIYPLERFLSGAIPFDLVVPGKGRGTIRVAPRAVVIMTPKPLFISLKKPVHSVRDLAEAIEGKFGTGCTLIGKAVTLIGMLSREWVFVFHEGASSYVKYSRKLHQLLAKKNVPIQVNPILRVRYNVWDALGHCYSWLRLPPPLQGPFGAEEICAPSFAARWREVSDHQQGALTELSRLHRSMDLIAYLERVSGGAWNCLAKDYSELHDRLESVEVDVSKVKAERRGLYGKLRDLRQARVRAERAKGEHWRHRIFEKTPTDGDWKERERLQQEVDHAIHAIAQTRQQIRELLIKQREIARNPEVMAIHDRRRSIEREAELKRLQLIRSGIIATRGLKNASLRPSAWWFPILCPDGGWFKETVKTAECYLEPLI